MTDYISTIRPGLLVSLHTAIVGNVSYTELGREKVATVEGELVHIETNKLTRDTDEQERAVKARALARSAIQTVCSKTKHGLICPTANEDKLADAIVKARRIVSDFNADARITTIEFNILRGRVAADDVEAVRAINAEVRGLIDAMANGIKRLDVQAVRDAATRATSVGKVLEENAREEVKRAITLARKVATEIKAAGEGAAIEIDQTTLQRLSEARTAFLDVDGQEDVAEVAAPAPVVAQGGLDFEPDSDIEVAPASVAQLDL